MRFSLPASEKEKKIKTKQERAAHYSETTQYSFQLLSNKPHIWATNKIKTTEDHRLAVDLDTLRLFFCFPKLPGVKKKKQIWNASTSKQVRGNVSKQGISVLRTLAPRLRVPLTQRL